MNLDGKIEYAGFWRRLTAALIDSVLFIVMLAIVLGPGYANARFLSFEWVIQNFLCMVITVALWVRYTGTPGKLLMGCQVMDAQSGRPVTVRQAILRYLGYYVSALALGLGFFWIMWDKHKQGFHDKIAKTVVLHNADLEFGDESRKSLQQLIGELR